MIKKHGFLTSFNYLKQSTLITSQDLFGIKKINSEVQLH